MTMPRALRRAIAAAAALFCALANAASQAPVAAEHGMVVTAHHLATKVGVSVLRAGGNAIDAAVAVGYALAVVYPTAGNLGGGGFMTIRFADGRKTFIDFREKAPLAARADMFLDANGNVAGNASTRGHLAVAVPGTVAGLELARGKYGTMRRADLMAPAVALAQDGFVLESADARMLGEAAADLARDPPSEAIFLERGKRWQAGSRLFQPDLARTLQAIARDGEGGFYKGPVAEAIVASSRKGGGILSLEDFSRYAPREMAPVECDYRGYRIVSAPPPSAGGAIVCEILNILEGYPLQELGFRSAQSIHYQIEAMRHAYLDRNSYLGDPDFVKNPVARLLDKQYAARIRAAIDPAKAASSLALKAGTAPHEGSNTTHYSIVDRVGNAVAVTYTLNTPFGARVTAAGTGVLLNNEMDDFTIKLGEGNSFGLVQGEPNRIEPGKTPLSSMSPTVVLKDDQVVMVLGTPGGGRIISGVVHTLINVIDYGMTIQEAVDAPRFHQQWLPEATRIERFAIPPDARRILESQGHRFEESSPWNHMTAILVGAPRLGGRPVGAARYYGANDPRGNTGLAAGY